MRRRRKPLEVSTFPFLAVLLCAMGSLILVLLVMDRKAKMAARAKAQESYASAVAKAADEADKAAAAHRAELDRRLREMRAEWENKRDALHTKLLSEQQTLQLQMQQLREKMMQAAARLRAEQEQTGELKKQIETSQGKLQGETAAVSATKATLADTEKHTEQERAALVRMTNDLIVLERALKDLKEARERERQTYSVVPYRGKRGESRRPLYIECTGPNVIFHPDQKALMVRFQPAEIRAEVEQRVARQRQQLAAAKMTGDTTPYLMLLVRPDGITSYYAFQAALAGQNVQFGYELIDADWLLEFPPDDEQPSTQPWQALAKQPNAAPPDAQAGEATVHGVQMGNRNAQLPPLPSSPPAGGVFPPAGGVFSGGRPGALGTGTGALGQPIGQGTQAGSGSGAVGAPGSGPFGSSNLPPGAVGNSLSNSSALHGIRSGTNDPIAGTSSSGSSFAAFGPPGTPSAPGLGSADGSGYRGTPGSASPDSLPLPTTLAQGGGPGGPPSDPWNIGSTGANQGGTNGPGPRLSPLSAMVLQENGVSMTPSGPPNSGGRGGDSNGSRESSSNLPPLPSGLAPSGGSFTPPYGGANTGSGGPAGNAPPDGSPPGAAPANGSAPVGEQPPPSNDPNVRSPQAGTPRRPGDPVGNPGDAEGPGGLRSFSAPSIEPKRPLPPLRAARLSGNRDYLIYIECKPDGVVLYPAQKLYPFASLMGGPNSPLVQAVQQMIERRQSSVTPGDMPYRPQVRFLVRPETLRAYHAAYPLFDGLPIAQTRQNLAPEDDVLSIVAGR
jgi:hypothetical protein